MSVGPLNWPLPVPAAPHDFTKVGVLVYLRIVLFPVLQTKTLPALSSQMPCGLERLVLMVQTVASDVELRR